MFKRKLAALGYPAAETFNVHDETDFRNLIVWLEDQKIRHCKVQDRNKLRDVKSSNWTNIYQAYLKEIASLPENLNREGELEALLAFAVRMEYSDNAEDFRTVVTKNVQDMNSKPKVICTNYLDSLDFQSPDFIKGISSLAKMLKITEHANHLVTLKAVIKLINSRLNAEALAKPNSLIAKGPPFPFQDADSGFEMNDNDLNQASKIMRLIYIHNLRGLQTKINECIAAVQTFTANPKTDTKLGQVGR